MTIRMRPGALFGLLALVALTSASAAGLSLASQKLAPYRTCTITATPSTTTVESDASVRQASPNTNFGTATTTNVATGNGANRRLYLRFDLTTCVPAIPSTATVRLATLRLYATAVPGSCRTIDLFRVTAAWSESTLTWNNQPFGTSINNPASSGAVDTFSIGTPAGCQNQATGVYVVGADPTTDVAAFVAGSATNNGWMLRDDLEGNASTLTSTFSSKDLGTASQAPQLVITYVVVP